MKTIVGAVAAVAGVLAVALAACGGSTTSQQLTPATPDFKVVAQTTGERFDNGKSYYIAIAPVDLSSGSFRQNVKFVLQTVAKSNGSPNFSASVYDDETIAERAFSYYRDELADIPPDEMQAQIAQEEQHLVAMYTGGIDFDKPNCPIEKFFQSFIVTCKNQRVFSPVTFFKQ